MEQVEMLLAQAGGEEATGHAQAAEHSAAGAEAAGHSSEGTQAHTGEVKKEGGGGTPELQTITDWVGIAYMNTKPEIRKELQHEFKVLYKEAEEGKISNFERDNEIVELSVKTLHHSVVPFGKDYKDFLGINYIDLSNIFYSFSVIILLCIMAIRVKSKLQKVPKGFQALIELFVNGMNTYYSSIMGPHLGRVFTPFVGTMFIYVLLMNYMGLLPAMKAPIAMNINIPLSMAICVFFMCHYHGIRQNGIKGYLGHYWTPGAGIPVMDQFVQILNLMLHIFGEFVKPISLTLRLFGNITGEEAVVAALILLVSSLPWYAPVPIHAFFLPLALLFGLIQAIVFSTLSAVYLLLMSKHEEHEEH